MARPKAREPDRRSIRLTARFNAAEADAIQRAADASEMTVSDAIRRAVLANPPPARAQRPKPTVDTALLAKTQVDLSRVGSLLNQLARQANMGSWPEGSLLREAGDDVRAASRAVMRALGVDPGGASPAP